LIEDIDLFVVVAETVLNVRA